PARRTPHARPLGSALALLPQLLAALSGNAPGAQPMHSLSRSRPWAAFLLLLASCSDSTPAPTKPTTPLDEVPTDRGTKVSLSLTAADSDTLSELDSALSELDSLDGPALAQQHPVSFESDLGYDPRTAHGLDL